MVVGDAGGRGVGSEAVCNNAGSEVVGESGGDMVVFDVVSDTDATWSGVVSWGTSTARSSAKCRGSRWSATV